MPTCRALTGPGARSANRQKDSEMNEVSLFRAADMTFEPYGGPPGVARIARLVGTETSTSMGAGVATFDACSIEWTILYDELIVVLEGAFRLVIGGRTYDMGPGDVIWLPRIPRCATRATARKCSTRSIP